MDVLVVVYQRTPFTLGGGVSSSITRLRYGH
jgi:hypothetical protein